MSRMLDRRLLVVMFALMLTFALVVESVAAPGSQSAAAEDDGLPAGAVGSDPLVRPDRLTAQITARQTGRRVEIASLTTEMAQTFANPDGTLTDELHAGPERVFDPDLGADGSWRDIDTTLVEDADGVHPVVAAADVAFSSGGDGPVASLADVDAETGEQVGFALDWAGMRLPAPELDGNVALYRDVEPGLDLELEALPAGYAKRLILNERPTVPVVWRFELDVDDQLELVQTDGGFDLIDADEEAVIALDGLYMWGADRDPASGEPVHRSEQVATRLVTTGGKTVLEVEPDFAFLTDPAVTFPVTVDPTASLALTGDTYIQTDSSTSKWSDPELRVGTFNGGSTKARSILRFDHTPMVGKHVLSASMELYNFHSWSCTARRVDVRRTTSAFGSSTVWSNRPYTTSTVYANPNFAKGYSSSCAAGFQTFNITSLVQAWADGTTNYGLMLLAPDETDNYSWKKFRSSDASSNRPKLTVTYNSYPNTATGRTVEPFATPHTSSLTPTLKAHFKDPDGGTGKVQNVIRNSAGTVIVDAFGSTVTAGSKSVYKVPSGKFVHGQTYRWTTRGYDGIDYSKSWPADVIITVDVQGPTAPTISSSTHSSTTDWYQDQAVSAAWTASSDTPAGVSGYAVRFNKDPESVPSTSHVQTGRTFNGTATSNGVWWLHVRPLDKAGNWGAITRRRFNIGTAGLLLPEDGTRTQKRVPLQAAGPTTLTSATFQWSRPGGGWADIPAARLALAATPDVPLTSTIVPMSGGETAELVWNVDGTVGGDDGPIHVRVKFNDNTLSEATRVGLDRLGAGKDHGAVDVGPGSVSLLSGNLNTTGADVSIGAWTSDLTLTRSHNSRAAAGDDLLFGPGWSSSLAVLEAAAGWDALTTPGHASTSTAAPYVLLRDLEGAEIWFDRIGGVYAPEDGFEDLTLTFASSTYTLTDLDGTVVTFKPRDGVFRPETITQSGDAGTTQYRWATVGGVMRPTRVVAPAPPGVSCSLTAATLERGCRGLDLIYDSVASTTRLVGVDLLAHDTDTEAQARVRLIDYGYDTSGRLTTVTDPRPEAIDGAGVRQPAPLTTSYGYDSAGRLTTVTPPGLAPWTIDYTTASGLEAGRVRSVARSNLAGGDNVTTLVYDVPRSGTSAPYPMSPTDIDDWGQTQSIPTDATAVFPPDAVPTSTLPASLTASAYARAEVTYLEASGRVTNVASPGGRITTTEYDRHGNTVRELTAANRARVLESPVGEHESLASQLDTVQTYDDTGLRLLEELGPEHEIELASGPLAGERVTARKATRTTYDQGLPSGMEPPHLPTTVEEGALLGDGSFHDVRTTTTAYDWELRLPTTVTVDPGTGGLNIVSTTVYDDAGLEIERRQPSEPGGGGPGTLRTSRYTAGTHPTHNAQCGNRPEWHGQQCLQTPAAQPTVTAEVPGLLSTHTAGYNLYLQPTEVVETAPTASGTVTRTSVTTYDKAGRIETVDVEASQGTSLPAVTTVYDPDTGATAKTAAGGSEIVQANDSLGRPVSYTDASGNIATTSYDPYGRVVSVNDGKASQTFTYDAITGFTTQVSDSQAGIWSAGPTDYDADGNLRGWDGPHGLRFDTQNDAAGNPTQQTVTQTENCQGDGCLWYAEDISVSIHGQWLSHNRPNATRDYRYDPAGRLIQATEDVDGVCQIRDYTFGAGPAGRNSNRTAKTVTYADETGDCDPATEQTTTYSHDNGDRLLDGVVYDGFGRATNIPATLLDGHGQLDAGYYANDLIHTLTQGGTSRTFALDPAGRFATETDHTSQTTIWRYADGSDAPAWHETGVGWTRTVPGIGGDLSATVTFDGQQSHLTTVITDLFGSVVMHIQRDETIGIPTPVGTSLSDEFGIPIDTDTPTPRYSWLGGKQRDTTLPSGVVLMGVRVYIPQLGRFLQTDPVLGGSATTYDYCNADPINCTDLDGRVSKPNTQFLRDLQSLLNKYRAPRHRKIADAIFHWGLAKWGDMNRWYYWEKGNVSLFHRYDQMYRTNYAKFARASYSLASDVYKILSKAGFKRYGGLRL